METKREPLMDRREFFRSMSRYIVLGGLVALGGELIKNPNSLKQNGVDAPNATNCRICPLLPSCELPDALKVTKMNPRQLRNCKFD